MTLIAIYAARCYLQDRAGDVAAKADSSDPQRSVSAPELETSARAKATPQTSLFETAKMIGSYTIIPAVFYTALLSSSVGNNLIDLVIKLLDLPQNMHIAVKIFAIEIAPFLALLAYILQFLLFFIKLLSQIKRKPSQGPPPLY